MKSSPVSEVILPAAPAQHGHVDAQPKNGRREACSAFLEKEEAAARPAHKCLKSACARWAANKCGAAGKMPDAMWESQPDRKVNAR